VTDSERPAAEVPVVRCPACHKLNRVPVDGLAKARCGSCRAALTPPRGASSAPRGGDLSQLVIQRWDALLRLVPKGAALGRAVGRSEWDDPASDPVGWLSEATQIPRDDLDQLRLMRIHLASKKVVPHSALTRALDTLDQAHSILGRTRLPE
jgi:hypothetical protein